MADSSTNQNIEVGKFIVNGSLWLWPPGELHINYWRCFDGNVQGLRDEIECLERERRNMEGKIEEARLRAKRPTTEVENWFNEGTQKLEEAATILQGCDGLEVWNIKSRYFVGKSVKEMAQAIAKLRNEGNSIRIADPAPPASMVPISHAPTLEFQSRKSTEEDIMKFLKDDNVRMIAICGAGGAGKTTMAQRIEDRVREDKLFDEVVNVVVSQPIDKLKIQKQIAEILRLDLSEETLDGRAHGLRTRLMDSKKKLIIFDDVWESFVLKDIGVPYGGCKIILTSRNKDVCEEMEADKVIEIQVLEEKEAWTLFREKSGDCVDDSDLRPIAEEVAAECKGLPIALVTVGKALQKKHINIWKDALLQLRGANTTDFPQVPEYVYKSLKLSYDFLVTESEKSLFLLCCLFPEDYNIPIEDLALLSFGLRLFEGIDNIEHGRNRTYLLLDRLKSRFLLMTGRDQEDEVKMHDVVRDVAIFIASKEKQGFLKSLEVSSKDSSRNCNCNWMSVDISNIANAKLPVGWLDFPNLRLLMILNSKYLEFPQGFDFNDKGMEELTILYFSNQKFQSLPSSLEFLKKLRKLHLYSCDVRDISVVGELSSLEILRVWVCHKIEELPAGVRGLKFLRLLELRHCLKLERIVAGVISSLVSLEELKIVRCFNKWEAKGNISEERNASLSELESLHNLASLEIEISDPKLVAQEILLSKHLRRYQISFSGRLNYDRNHERKIELCLLRDVTVGNWIRPLVKNTQSLELYGDGSNYLNLDEIESLRELRFENCSTVDKLVNAVDCKFPMLEHLELESLIELEEIIDGTIPAGSNSFQNLKSIDIEDCPKLGYLWKSPDQNVYLVNLKSIRIWNCPNLRYLFSTATARSLVQLRSLEISYCETMDKLVNAVDCKFPMLEHLQLKSLVELEEIIDGTIPEGSNSFQNLESIEIEDCPKLGYLWKSPNQNVYLVNLKSIYIIDCTNLRYLFSTATARSLVQLQSLEISDCENMEQVLWNEMESNSEEGSIIEFPKVERLTLNCLPKLLDFTQLGVEIIKFPQLIQLEIQVCPRLRTKIDNYPTCMIEKLHVLRCDTIEEILRDDGNRHIIFQELRKLKLTKLPCLTTLGVESIKFPKLEEFWVENLPRRNSFVAIDSEPTHDHHCLHFVCNKKVEMIGLKELYLRHLPDEISKMWCRHIPNSFFHNLVSLSIYEVDGIMNLLSSSTATALVHLNSLYIYRCQKMIDVIVDDTQVPVNSVFPKLETLKIVGNCKLTSFCQWKHAFELPSLENVEITDCPLMKTFTLGSLNTPKLHHFVRNNKIIEMKDLKGGIHRFISTETMNKYENEDEYNEDEEHEYSDEDEEHVLKRMRNSDEDEEHVLKRTRKR